MALFEGLDQIPDPVYVEDGIYDVTVESAKVKVSKDGKTSYVAIILNIDDHPEAEPIFYTLFLVNKEDEERKRMMTMRAARAFCQGLGIDLSGSIDTEDFKGKTGRAAIKTVPRKDNEDQLEHVLVSWA